MSNNCEGPKRLRISWTKLQTNELCKQKRHLMGQRKQSPVQNVRNFFHGNVADRCMRKWLDSDNPQPGEMVSWVDDMIEQLLAEQKERGEGVVRWKHRDDRSDMADYVRTLLGRLEPFLLRDVLPYDYQPEYRFRVPVRIPDLAGNLSEIDLVGGMDILVRESEPQNIWAGYDLKATQNPDYLAKTLGQGIFYSLAQLAERGAPFRTFAFVQPMVEKNPLAYVSITDADMAQMLQRITRVAHDIWRGDNAPKKGLEGCAWCPVKAACERFRPGSGSTFAPKSKLPA